MTLNEEAPGRRLCVEECNVLLDIGILQWVTCWVVDMLPAYTEVPFLEPAEVDDTSAPVSV